MLVIFDTKGGLCNQFYDIMNGINFCLKYNIFFTFRYCSLRNKDLKSWTNQPFEKLFDVSLFDNYKLLYKNYNDIKDELTDDNCFNLNGDKLSHIIFNKDDILNQMINLNKKYIVLSQFWSLYKFKDSIDNSINKRILPCKYLMDNYNKIKNKIINNESYNFIHYRYEIDFSDYFKIKIDSLDDLLEKIKFKNTNLKIYVATSNIKKLIDLTDNKYKNLIYKDDELLTHLNFEENAFIDYIFGINAKECYGHSYSSFSHMINNIKDQNNFYNL